MLITKTESESVCARQVEFLRLLRPLVPMTLNDGCSYSYKYIVGDHLLSLTRVHKWLEDNVWCSRPLKGDLGDYPKYIADLVSRFGGDMAVVNLLEKSQSQQTECLVHGDATLSNFIRSPSGEIVPIDPGLSRGFNSQENDKGKLLQSWLTRWGAVSCDSAIDSVYDPPGFSVTVMTLASLMSHWYRILKNETRHRHEVGVYARTKALPCLQKSIMAASFDECEQVPALRLREIWDDLRP